MASKISINPHKCGWPELVLQDRPNVPFPDMRVRNRHTLFCAMVRGDPTVTLWVRGPGDPFKDILDTPESFFSRLTYVWDYCSFQRGNYPGDTSGQARHRRGAKSHNIMATVVEPTVCNVPESKLVRKTNLHLFNFDGFRQKWVKVLARGGNGAATLWHALYEDGTKEYFVMKIMTGNSSPAEIAKKVRLEKSWHEKYEGAECIVQHYNPYLVASRHMVIDESGEGMFPGEIVQFDQIGALPLEFMTRGSLKNIMGKAAELKLPWPNAALWQLFRDLAMGVSEVALHRKCLEKWQTPLAEMYRDELLCRPRQAWLRGKLKELTPANDVHFDLEENNILATDAIDSEGKPSIRFKLHDFGGWSYAMDDEYDCRIAPGYMSMRRPLKPGRHLPEQIVREWDSQPYPETDVCPARYAGANLDDKDLVAAGTKTQIAGRYGFWSNTFIIAKMLEIAITGYVHTHPFAPKVPRDHWSEEELRQSDCDPAARMDWPTYGWRLADPAYAQVCPNLRWLVIACLSEDPRHRPPPSELLPRVALFDRQGATKMTAEAEAFWKLIKEPIAGSRDADAVVDSSSDDDSDDDGEDDGEDDSEDDMDCEDDGEDNGKDNGKDDGEDDSKDDGEDEDDPNDEDDTKDAKSNCETELTLKPSRRSGEHNSNKHEDEDITMKDMDAEHEDITMKDASTVYGVKRKNTVDTGDTSMSSTDGAQDEHRHKRVRYDLKPRKGVQGAAARRPLVRCRPQVAAARRLK